MWLILKWLLTAILLAALAAGGYAGWMLFKPVTAADVETRMSQVCLLGKAARWIDRRAPNVPMDVCECSTKRAIAVMGPQEAARRMELFRGMVTKRLSGSSLAAMRQGVERKDFDDVEALMKSITTFQRQCALGR